MSMELVGKFSSRELFASVDMPRGIRVREPSSRKGKEKIGARGRQPQLVFY